MKPALKLALVATMIVFSASLAHALALGGADGGGGRGVLCVDKQGRKTVELLDLYESRILYKRPPVISKRPMLEQATDAMIKMVGHVPDSKILSRAAFAAFAQETFEKIVPQRDAKLKEIDDSKEIVTPPANCKIQQLANYTEDGFIIVQEELWNHMNATNRAALLVHEFYYHVARVNIGAKNSKDVRKRVGLVFSGYQFGQPRMTPPGTYICTGEESLAYVYPENGSLTLEVASLKGRTFFGGAYLRNAFWVSSIKELVSDQFDPNFRWTHWDLTGIGSNKALINYGLVNVDRKDRAAMSAGRATFEFKVDSYPERTNRDPETTVTCRPFRSARK